MPMPGRSDLTLTWLRTVLSQWGRGAGIASFAVRGLPSALISSYAFRTRETPTPLAMRAALLIGFIFAAHPASALPNGAELNPVLGSSLNLGLTFTDSTNHAA